MANQEAGSSTSSTPQPQVIKPTIFLLLCMFCYMGFGIILSQDHEIQVQLQQEEEEEEEEEEELLSIYGAE